jgi:heptose I phosphotransferase
MTETLWRRLTRGVQRVRQRADWPGIAGPDWVERIMHAAVTDRFHAKQGRTTGRLVLEASGRRLAVYLKRHYVLARWRGWLATLWPARGWSPALQEWHHLGWAQRRGLPVPAGVAAAEYIGPWGRLQSVLAIEELSGMLALHEAIPAAAEALAATAFRAWKRGLVAELARLTRALHDRRYFHKDLYLCHFFVHREDICRLPTWRGRVHLIDLHRLRRHRWTWRWWQAKDLGQLLYASELAGVDARDRLRFWRAYKGKQRRRGWAPWLRRAVIFRWQRYRGHNRGRRG